MTAVSTDLAIVSTLRQLPLFMGMSDMELKEILARVKCLYRKVGPGEPIVSQGDRSGSLWMVVGGTFTTTAYSADYDYSVTEYLHSPALLQIECAFGWQQRFTRTYKAETPCNLMTISKTELQQLCSDSLIFRINLLNILSTSLQKSKMAVWANAPKDMRDRLAHFLLSHFEYPAGHKIFKIRMERLAEELHTSRLTVSNTLRALAADGLLSVGRGSLDIPAAQLLRD